MLAYYDYIITRETFRFVRNYHVRISNWRKNSIFFFFWRSTNRTSSTSRTIPPPPLFHPLVSFHLHDRTRGQHRNKTATNTIPRVNVSLPSSIAKTIYFDLDQCLSTIFFKLRFPFLALCSRIRVFRVFFYFLNRTH